MVLRDGMLAIITSQFSSQLFFLQLSLSKFHTTGKFINPEMPQERARDDKVIPTDPILPGLSHQSWQLLLCLPMLQDGPVGAE